jgi:acyl carrier protein
MKREELKTWLIDKIAEESGLPLEKINADEPFDSFNLDSLSMITISSELENVLGAEIDPTMFWKFNSINLLAEAIELRV